MKLLLKIGVVLLLYHLLLSASSSPAMTAQEERGKQIYVEGTSPAGRPITASVGRSSLKLPGKAMKCASCHGADGLGNPEAGLIPSNVTWSYLTKPYGLSHKYGREHPPYTEKTVGTAIRAGLDSAGNELDAAMPRYEIADEDLADLIAYLKVLEADLDPGLSNDRIRIGAVLPAEGRLQGFGRSMRAVLKAYFDDINESGGINGRMIELVVADYHTLGSLTIANVKKLIEEEAVFALSASVVSGSEQEVLDYLEERAVPFVGPFSSMTDDVSTLYPNTFYLFSGIREQAIALVDYVTGSLAADEPRFAVVAAKGDLSASFAAAVRKRGQAGSAADVLTITYEPGGFEAGKVIQSLGEAGVSAVFFYGQFRDLVSLLKEADRAQQSFYVLLPGALIRETVYDIPLRFHEKVYLSYPTLPADRTPEGVQEFRALVEKHSLPVEFPSAQIHAFLAAKVLVEGVKRSGRRLSRKQLVTELEGFLLFRTGLSRPITYHANRRVGALGAHIVGVDLEKKRFMPAAWMKLE